MPLKIYFFCFYLQGDNEIIIFLHLLSGQGLGLLGLPRWGNHCLRHGCHFRLQKQRRTPIGTRLSRPSTCCPTEAGQPWISFGRLVLILIPSSGQSQRKMNLHRRRGGRIFFVQSKWPVGDNMGAGQRRWSYLQIIGDFNEVSGGNQTKTSKKTTQQMTTTSYQNGGQSSAESI